MSGESSTDNQDIRSWDVVFVPFCLLCRGVVAQGLVKQYTAIVKPIVQELIDRDINFVQMPCPELHLGSYEQGLCRKPKLKSEYDTAEFRDICQSLGKKTADLITAMHNLGYNIKCILGIEYSPSCAVKYVFKSHSASYSSKGYTGHESGIFIEELDAILKERGIEIPLLGVHLRGMKKSKNSLLELIDSDNSVTQPNLF